MDIDLNMRTSSSIPIPIYKEQENPGSMFKSIPNTRLQDNHNVALLAAGKETMSRLRRILGAETNRSAFEKYLESVGCVASGVVSSRDLLGALRYMDVDITPVEVYAFLQLIDASDGKIGLNEMKQVIYPHAILTAPPPPEDPPEDPHEAKILALDGNLDELKRRLAELEAGALTTLAQQKLENQNKQLQMENRMLKQEIAGLDPVSLL